MTTCGWQQPLARHRVAEADPMEVVELCAIPP
jgi:hypothetical protein